SDFQNFYNALHLADSAYGLYGAAHYAGVEYSVFAKEYQQFSDSAIQWLSAPPHDKSDLLVRFMLSTKTLGMSNYIKKMRRQVAFESDSLLYDDWKKRQRALLVLRNRLKEETEPDSVRQIQHRLADLLYIELNSMYVSDWEVDAGLTEVPSAENIQRILDDNACLLNYRLVGEQVFVLAITHDKITLHREHLPTQLIKKNRYLLKTGGRMQPQFTELLLGGLDELLTGKDHLVIIPDQELLLLPFEALPWKGEYLLAHYAVSYQYSVDLWLNSVLKDREELPWRMLSVAPGFLSEQEWQGYISQRGGTDNMALAPLRYSLEEVDEVEALNRKAHKEYKVLRGNEANEEQVKRIFADYSVLHFATHGYVNKKYPELSGLYLYASEDEINKRDDDFLSLGEIYLHDLQANLAILSACKTGMGKIQPGEGITALPRGFMLAGVPNVVATLWNVDDRVSKNLMIAFYKNVLQSGDGYAKALQKAKLQMVDKGVLPVDWSGFILIGK
ncbi:MAG: CHAT domain-containing protein, partial [Bacteroidales bacterium]